MIAVHSPLYGEWNSRSGRDSPLKLGIIGLPGSGKTTVFRALTGGIEIADRKGHLEPALGVVKVSDPRLDWLADHYKPKKVTPVHVEYMDIPGVRSEGKVQHSISDKILAHTRTAEALVHCVRFYDSVMSGAANPLSDYKAVEDEMILSDFAIVEKRLERLSKDAQKGRKDLTEELSLLKEAYEILEQGKPLRIFPPASESDKLKGFAFLSAKPQLLLINAGENKTKAEIEQLRTDLQQITANQPNVMIDSLNADAEAEIARLSEEDAREFLDELELEEGAKERIIKKSFELLNYLVFFTAGEPEVRAWQLQNGMSAVKAAGTVHSDMERGFIRAEVVSYEDFNAAGSLAAAHKVGKVRLEGRDYVIKDGDIILFRFNV
jgi:GTP-binding protein YchF